MKTAIIVAAFGALALTAVGCKDKAPETTNPDVAAPAVEETAPAADETPAADAEEEAAEGEEKAEEAAE